MSADFMKVYPGFFEGSLRDGRAYTSLLFLAMLSRVDENGVVLGTPSFWVGYIGRGITEEGVSQGIEDLNTPDPNSTSPDEEGRRIVPWGGGANQWRVVNYKKYYERSRAEERKEYKREWDKLNRKKGNPTDSDNPDKSDPESESENESENENENKLKGLIALVTNLGYEELIPDARRYEKHRVENKWPSWKQTTIESRSKSWKKFTADQIRQAMSDSIDNGWRGIFPEKVADVTKVRYERV